jgi:hypothetical protein
LLFEANKSEIFSSVEAAERKRERVVDANVSIDNLLERPS